MARWRRTAPFPHPAHQTGRADFPHPAFGQGITRSPTEGCAFATGASEPFREVVGSSPISCVLATSCVDLEPRPLCSPDVTPDHRSYGPLRHPTQPGLVLAGVRLEVTPLHCVGLPVLRQISLYVHAVTFTLPPWSRSLPAEPPDSVALTHWPGPSWNPATAAFPVIQAGRLPRCPFRGLLSVHSRYGLHVRRVAQGDPLHRRLQPIRHLLDCSDCYRLERPLAGWESHPLKIHAFARRTE